MNSFIDFNSQTLSNYFNMQPSSVKGRANAGVEYYKRMLYTKVYSVFQFTLPETWALNYFRFWLFHFGSIAVIYTNEFGWVCQPYSVKKLDLYYNPQVIEVYNQHITTPKTGIVGVNSDIVRLMDDYFGIDDIVTRYAEQLAQCDRSINVNLMNSNVTAYAEVESKKQANDIQEAYGDATTGKPFVVLNKDVLNGKQIGTLMSNVSGNFIADRLHVVRRNIMNAFLTEIGIRNANYDKKERVNSAEVSENNDETRAIVEVMFDNIKSAFDRINEFADLGLDVALRYDYETINNESEVSEIG